MSIGPLTGLFSPDRVAVVGATDREGSLGRALLENLKTGFEGAVIGVNPNRDSVLGLPCVPSMAETHGIDLAVIAVPAEAAVEAVREAAEAGTENIVVITAGFGEASEAGADRERELARIAHEHDVALVGPNSLGVVGTTVGLNATFAPITPPSGSLSFLSQSGAVVTAVLDQAEAEGLGFENVVSLGNKTVLDEIDFIEAWEADPDTDVIIGYLENIRDGRGFLDRVGDVTRSTPVVLIKAGRTSAGARAAASHTGAITGSERAVEAGLQQAGVLRAESLQDLFDQARALSNQPLPDSNRIAVLTNTGGLGVLAADAVVDTPLELAAFDGATADTLDERLPDSAEVGNPLDIIGDATVDRFESTLEVVLADPTVDAGLVLAAPSALLSYEDLAAAIVHARRTHELPIVTCLMGGKRVQAAERVLDAHGIPNYPGPDRAISGLEALVRYRRVRDRTGPQPEPVDVDRSTVRAVLDERLAAGHTTLGVESMAVLRAFGFTTPAGKVVTDADAASAVAHELDAPVALKVVSPDIAHKTDVEGVVLDVSPEAVGEQYRGLVDRVASRRPDAAIEGVLVQEVVDSESSVETLVGIKRDSQFGPLVVFGLGGIFVEVFEDIAVRIAPVDRAMARAMTEQINASAILRGVRGQPAVDLEALVDAIQRISLLAVEFPSIQELDVNPLLATPDGAIAVDFRATLDEGRS